MLSSLDVWDDVKTVESAGSGCTVLDTAELTEAAKAS